MSKFSAITCLMLAITLAVLGGMARSYIELSPALSALALGLIVLVFQLLSYPAVAWWSGVHRKFTFRLWVLQSLIVSATLISLSLIF